MSKTDVELDNDWKPNGRRPQSTIAQNFQQELMDIFRIDDSVADLDEKVDKRKKEINSAASELEALEARIREMEQRLKQAPAGSQLAQHQQQQRPPAAVDTDQNQKSRPGTARQGGGGALPPTPVESEGEYRLHYTHNLAFRPSSHHPNPHPSSRPPQQSGGGRDNSDSQSIKSLSASVSSNLTAADYVFVSSPRASDGDREQDA
ncbi:hypothetical protein QBC42DRAFT_284223 [Cladorrhinum samala]|uniref:Uncharacterized protein n=1 Tax=Cladorrhinum samala TaxID=585594 RepID=A0AAV9HUX2_9PEZI|nr:hypothetical protein QBC42DRAFT_284223 [Cladorrhinum samala]